MIWGTSWAKVVSIPASHSNTNAGGEKLVRPFPLFHEPLFRFEIYRTHEGSYLFLDVHHLIADGTSLSIILSDIDRAYQGEKLTAES